MLAGDERLVVIEERKVESQAMLPRFDVRNPDSNAGSQGSITPTHSSALCEQFGYLVFLLLR